MKYFIATLPLLLISACNVKEELGLTEATRIPVQNENAASCPQWNSGDTITINEDFTVPKGCNYDRVAFNISSSNVTFDCNNSIMNGLGKTERNAFLVKYPLVETPRTIAFSITASENNFLENITVKNCDLRYYVNGFNIGFGLNESTRNDLKNNVNVTELEKSLRAAAPKNILLDNNRINGSHKAGVFVQRYITGLTINNNVINDAGDMAIYLESGTLGNTISNSSFSKNGETTYSVEDRVRKIRVPKREAIAVDSSSYNIIKNNTFTDNAGGAIFIYKNCYERYTEDDSLPRYQKSDYNTIENNAFINEEKGVWLASRQDRDLENFDCGDPSMLETDDNKKYYQDYAKYNKVINNTFEDVEKGVIVEDDYNTVSNNHFKGESRNDVIIGSDVRSVHLNQPVTGTIVSSNIFDTTSDPHVRITFGSTASEFTNNQPAVSVEASTVVVEQ